MYINTNGHIELIYQSCLFI